MTDKPRPEDDPILRLLSEVQGTSVRGHSESPPPRAGGRAALLLSIFFLSSFVLVPMITGRLTDWLWFQEIGFERVFVTRIVAQWALGIATFVAAFAVLYGNARLAMFGMEPRSGTLREQVQRVLQMSLPPRVLFARLAATAALPLSALLALFVAVAVSAQWESVLELVHRTSFGVADPVFGRDVSYYVWILPAISLATDVVWLLLVLSLALLAVPIYAARGEVAAFGYRIVIRPLAQSHLAALVALLLVTHGVRMYFVQLPSLLTNQYSVLAGANYTDLNFRIPAMQALAVAAFVGAIVILVGARRGRLVPVAIRVIAGYAALALLSVLGAAAFQRLLVQPNELARESPQIVQHIAATRAAWGIASVERRELGTDTRLTPALLADNRATIDNVRLWDREPLLQTYGQIQSIRTYYDFVSVDDDRYIINGELRQVMLSARELNSSALPTRGFINEHLTYTHGMGVTLGPSNQVTAEGLPVLFIRDLPPVATTDVSITRPQIYFGELAESFVLAPSRQREFDYPAGEGDAAVYSQYDGRGGVSINSFGRRLLFALRFKSMNIVLSGDVLPTTKILFHRQIRERATRALPFVVFDRDPYLVITEAGLLKWMLDAYTTTERYPYAAAAGGVTYMRNSVKVVIDAYDGDVQAYISDPNDPMIRTFERIYPGTMQPLDSMPADLRAHIRYPEDLFRLQTALYATYHMGNPETFYHREDQWQIPGGGGEGQRRGVPTPFLRHMVMKLPGEELPEFILMRPFTPRQKDNLAAWMVARNDGEHYGRLIAYRFPRQSLVFGPNQIINRINQDTDVAREVTLWDQRGSEVLRGELLVIPIAEALLYVQPLYLRAQGGRIPELKRVIVAHEGRVAMEETLEGALARLFGAALPRTAATAAAAPGAAPTTPLPADAAPAVEPTPRRVDTAMEALLRQANEHYERARAAQRADDWSAYGTEMRRLGEVLRQLRERQP
jgi:uncharacterized protein